MVNVFMENSNSKKDSDELKETNQDRWLGIFLLLIGGGLFWRTFYFRTFDWDTLGMAFWPRVLLAILALCSVAHIIKGNIGNDVSEPIQKRGIILFFGAISYVFLLDIVGFYLLTPIAACFYSIWLRPFNKHTVITAFILAVGGTFVAYLIFELGMGVYMPRGIFE